MTSIQVFSPHFDDATLSCGEHILRWRKKGLDVEVVNVFTEFEAKHLSPDSQEFMAKGGIHSADDFQRARAEEDRASMKKLHVNEVKLLGIIDAGFREDHEKPTYPTHRDLFAGKILDNKAWQKKLESKLEQSVDKDAVVVVPLGVGQHADHLLVCQFIQKLVPEGKLLYYIDVPYAFQLANWQWQQIRQFIASKKSFTWSSAEKIAAVNVYNSQVPLLFQDGMWQYPECMVGQALETYPELYLS